MERHASALKAARQAVKRNERNRSARAQLRTLVKNLRTAATTTKDKAAAQKTLPAMLNEVQRGLMKAASKNLIRKGNASRQIARLSTLVHKATV